MTEPLAREAANARSAFAVLPVAFQGICASVGPARSVSGRQGAIRFGGVGGPIASMNRLMLNDSAEPLATRDLETVLERMSALPTISAWVPMGGVAMDAIGAQLTARGFEADPEDSGAGVPAMTAPLVALPHVELPAGVTLRKAETARDVELGNEVVAGGFGAPPALAAVLTSIMLDAVLDPAIALSMTLADVAGEPAASALGSIMDDVLGIYSVATLPRWRGRGLGRQITLATMHDGARLGAGIAALESSDMGYSIYRRLGFEEGGRYRVFVRSRPE